MIAIDVPAQPRSNSPGHRGATDVRCKDCGILLGKIDESGLNIRRNDLQATVTGVFHASIVCYRSRCRTLNVLRLPTPIMSVGPAP